MTERRFSEDEVAEAAQSLDRPAIPRMTRRYLGATIGVGRTYRTRPQDLRRGVGAGGRAAPRDLRRPRPRKAHVSMREWTNGNLQALLEPTAPEHRIRLRTMHGASRALLASGIALIATAGAMLTGTIIGLGFPGTDVLEQFAAVGLIGGVLYASGLIRLPGWARRRQEQMDEIAEILKTGLDR